MKKIILILSILLIGYTIFLLLTFEPNFSSSTNEEKSVLPSVSIEIKKEYPPETKFNSIPTKKIPLPKYLESYEDEIFHSKVTRITQRESQSDSKHPYSKKGSAWNNNMQILRLGYRLYDAKTFKELLVSKGKTRTEAYKTVGSPRHGTGDIRWSTIDSNIMYTLTSDKKFVSIRINKDKSNTSLDQEFIDLSSYKDVSLGNSEGNLDYKSQYIVFSAKKENDDKVYALLYKLGDKTLTWEKVIPHALWSSKNNKANYFDWISVDALAQHIVSSVDHNMYVYNMQLENEVKLENYASHGDLGIDVNGDPVYVQFVFHGKVGIYSYNLNHPKQPRVQLLPKKYSGGHVSCRNYQLPGWCYLSTSQEGYREVIALKLDQGTGTVRRFAQTHMSFEGHDETQVNVSPNGKKILFASDWNIDATIDTYHVSYPSP